MLCTKCFRFAGAGEGQRETIQARVIYLEEGGEEIITHGERPALFGPALVVAGGNLFRAQASAYQDGYLAEDPCSFGGLGLERSA